MTRLVDALMEWAEMIDTESLLAVWALLMVAMCVLLALGIDAGLFH